MKVLMLNKFDGGGGAARAAVRLHRGLRAAGVASRVLVEFKSRDEDGVIDQAGSLTRALRRLKYADLLPAQLYPNRPYGNFSPAWLPDGVGRRVSLLDPDLVHLHWVGAGFLRAETLGRIARPLVWTLHDSWAFTGGCHVPGECLKYRERCGTCPVLGSGREQDLSRRVWQRKKGAWAGLNLTVVAPSRWLAECARSSSLFRDVRVEVIPNGLPTETLRSKGKVEARHLLGLPGGKKIILFGAANGVAERNKGFHLLQPALQRLADEGSMDTLAVVFGCSEPLEKPDLGMPVVFLGPLDDEALAAAYSAADVFVAPSLQEAFCQTAAEAMACGTPVVAFGATGLLDVVEHRGCGYLARPYESEDLARGIRWVLEDGGRHAELSVRARQKVEQEFSLSSVSRRYADLYREILGRQEGRQHA